MIRIPISARRRRSRKSPRRPGQPRREAARDWPADRHRGRHRVPCLSVSTADRNLLPCASGRPERDRAPAGLAKQILRAAADATKAEPRRSAVFEQTRAVLFLSTPHAGAELASLVNAFTIVFGASVSIEDLRAHDAHLGELFNWYRNHADAAGIHTKTYYEQRETGGLLIVNPPSAHPGVGDDPIRLDEDHLSIAKPRSREAQVYGAACGLVREHVLAGRPAVAVQGDRAAFSALPLNAIAVAGAGGATASLNPASLPRLDQPRVPCELPPAAESFVGRETGARAPDRQVERCGGGASVRFADADTGSHYRHHPHARLAAPGGSSARAHVGRPSDGARGRRSRAADRRSDGEQPAATHRSDAGVARRGLLRRLQNADASTWQFTHVLGYRFARQETGSDGGLKRRLGRWAHQHLAAALNARAFGATPDAARALEHAAALMRTDDDQQLWRPLVAYLFYTGFDRLLDLGQLSQVDLAVKACEEWLGRLDLMAWVMTSRLRERAVLWNWRALVLREQGDLSGALTACRESLAVRQRLANADPSNAKWQSDLSLTLNHVGRILYDQDDLPGALDAHREALTVALRLAATDPSNAGWQRDLWSCYTEMAATLDRTGNRPEALRFAEESLAIDERLASLDPTNVIWQKDLRVSRKQVARLRS